MRNQKGFSLIELLLVVSVILIISAIAVPNFLRSRMRANEASAIASVRMIDTAAVTYAVAYPDIGFPAVLTSLGGADPCAGSPATACLIDDSIAQGAKGGYAFVWTGDGATPSVNYNLTGTPQAPGSSGQTMYCSDQTAVIHFELAGAGCTNASPVLQ
jgi:type IV pilus assembly protein PilA